ncbi:hypothetical protein KY321_04990 [Candidatus Woesearchaeota archaeon]|nr:hypothetical protein [Candidatus Woesearchaeota archaeon]
MKVNLCQIEDLKLHCMGCCGHDFKSREEVEAAIKKNTESFHRAKDKKKWALRSPGYVRPCGICYSIILDGYKAYCPLHPSKNQGKDLRDSDCDLNYLCKTFKLFNTWDEKKQQKFLDFLKSKKLDWYEYSTGMDQDTLLKEFEEL